MKTRTMYMHTLDGKPASYRDMRGSQFLAFAAEGHRSRAARLVPSLDQIRREQARCIRAEFAEWAERNAKRPEPVPRPSRRYGYVLVEVPV